MEKYQINIQVKNKLGFPFKRDRVRNIVKLTFQAEGIKHYIEAGIVFTDDQTGRRLNKKYRDIDRATDVLSFSLVNEIEDIFKTTIKSSANMRIQLGEIIISYPAAVKQAHEQECSVEQEVALLLVHGTLHLLGYDHKHATEARRMEAREKAIMKIIDISRGHSGRTFTNL